MLPYVELSSRGQVRRQLLTRHDQAIKSGETLPFLYPWSTVAVGLVLAYLLIPHGHSGVVRQARYLVWALNTSFSIHGLIYSRMRIAFGYCGGLALAWAILWTNVLLLNHDVQRDFKRIESTETASIGQGTTSNGHFVGDQAGPGSTTKTKKYRWESYPTESVSKRMLWIADLFTQFRGIGWNWQLATLPPPPRKVQEQLGKDPSHDSPVGRDGTRRYDDRRQLLRSAAIKFAFCYLSLEGLIVLAIHDPYFWGRIKEPAPAFLPVVFRNSAFLLRAYRSIFTMLGVNIALQFFFALGPLIFVGLLGSERIGVWGEPWMYPDVWGSFRKVLDYGLIGFWGSWWHQAFRYAFESNATTLMNLFGLDETTKTGKFLKLLFAFLLSGFLHASASLASLGQTRPFSGPLVFFALQPFGITAQMLLRAQLRQSGIAEKTPKLVQQLFTLSMTYLWLHFTAPLLCDDFARSGIWMVEPLPIGPVRMFGLGKTAEDGWYWRGTWVTWHNGKHWWQTGIAL